MTTLQSLPSTQQPGDLGGEIRRFGSGFYATWMMVLMGVFIILVPVVIAIAYSADGKSGAPAALLVEVIFLPLGCFTIWRGLRQRGAYLSIRQNGFAYSSDGNAVREARYSDVEKIVLRTIGGLAGSDGSPDSIAVHLRDGSTFVIKGIAQQGVTDGYTEIERRL